MSKIYLLGGSKMQYFVKMQKYSKKPLTNEYLCVIIAAS